VSILDIRLFGDPVLRQRARPVTDFDESLERLAVDMLETMREASGVGLAAPQVGILKRLFTWEVEEDNGAVVNPVLLDASEDLVEDDEGCLSFPGLYYPVRRPLRARVQHADVHGEDHTTDLEDFDVRVWLHEMDHLNGILFIDHLAKHDRKAAMRQMRQMREGSDEGPEPGSLLLGRR
jgi:peptide deformylase